MGVINLTLPADGSTIDAADYNTPLTTIQTEINGNLDDANIEANAAIDFSKIAGGSSTALTDWTAFSGGISSTSGTITSGSCAGHYKQIGKTVSYRAAITITTNGTGAGAVIFNLPATSATATGNTSLGSGREGIVGGKLLAVVQHSTTQGVVYNYDNSYPGGSGYTLFISGVYEAD